MADALERRPWVPLHPLHAVLLAGSLPLFLGVLLSDFAYNSTYEIQWKNFASWLLVGALVYCGFALLWGVIDMLRADRRGQRAIPYLIVLLATWVIGFVDALVHAKDAWASMPTALILSIIVAVLAFVATWLGFSTLRPGERP